MGGPWRAWPDLTCPTDCEDEEDPDIVVQRLWDDIKARSKAEVREYRRRIRSGWAKALKVRTDVDAAGNPYETGGDPDAEDSSGGSGTEDDGDNDGARQAGEVIGTAALARQLAKLWQIWRWHGKRG